MVCSLPEPLPPNLDDSLLEPRQETPQETPLVQVMELVKFYRQAQEAALDGLSFSIDYGEIFGLLGPNGAGKTTAISILCGLLEPSDGEVWIEEIDVRRQRQQLRPLIGFVPQEIALYERLTVWENLRYFAHLQGLRGPKLTQRLDECLQLAGLQEVAHRQISTFSGGMKRRANLIAGILHRPRLLLLDEPTVGIDVQSRNMIFESLRRLNNEGMTILYTTHYMEEAEQLCTRVAILDEGKLVTQGSPEQLIAQHPPCANLEQLFLQLTGKELRD